MFIQTGPRVRIKQGTVEGRKCVARKGVKFYSFQGIPYARPPVGKFRFKAPQPPKPWDAVLDATAEAPQCYQRHMIRFDEVGGSEDCLYLNVFTPELSMFSGPYPVMVWIHGGGFVSGSSKTELCGPDFLMTQDIVLVTFNYRVGMLGFMSLKDEAAGVPGNAGLKDQVMALQWIKNNIRTFRGDKNCVTLFGNGSGAACVHLHMLSPMSKGLFHRAIMQSGCALNPWVNGILASGRMMADLLEIEGTDEKVVEKMRDVPVEQIQEAQEKLTNDNRVDVRWLCSPVVERQKREPRFLPDEPINIIRSGTYNRVPIMIGYTNREGIFWDIYNRQTTGEQTVIFDLNSKTVRMPHIAKPMRFCDVVAGKSKEFYKGPHPMDTYPRLMLENWNTMTDITFAIPNNLFARKGNLISQTIAREIKNYYWGSRLQKSRIARHPRIQNMEPLYQLLTDVFFLRGIHTTVRNHYDVAPFTPIFYYRFSFQTKLNIFRNMLPPAHLKKYSGACHGDDIGYLFNTYLTPEFGFGEIEDKAINKLVRIWATFAETGSPVSEMSYGPCVDWDPIFKNSFQYLEIAEDFQKDAFPDMDRMIFWDHIYQNDRRSKFL